MRNRLSQHLKADRPEPRDNSHNAGQQKPFSGRSELETLKKRTQPLEKTHKNRSIREEQQLSSGKLAMLWEALQGTLPVRPSNNENHRRRKVVKQLCS